VVFKKTNSGTDDEIVKKMKKVKIQNMKTLKEFNAKRGKATNKRRNRKAHNAKENGRRK
jgi:hypothetical protein